MYSGKKGEIVLFGVLALIVATGLLSWFSLDQNSEFDNSITSAVIGTEQIRIQATYGGDGAADCGTNVVESSTLVGNVGPCDLTNGLNLGANDITFDCRGYQIIGFQTAGNAAIAIAGSDRTTIKNCVFTNFTDGVDLSSDTDNTTIMNNTFLYNLTGGTIIGVDLSGGSDYTWIVNNTFRGVSVGIGIAGSYNTSIQDNFIANASSRGISISSIVRANTTIHNNTFFMMTGTGVRISSSSLIKIIGNNFTNVSSGNAIAALTSANEISVEYGSITQSQNSIDFSNTQNSSIYGILIRDDAATGITLTVSSFNITIDHVTVIDSDTNGIFLNGNSGATNVTIKNSNISRNRNLDISLTGGITQENYTIFNNQISSNISVDVQVDTNGTRIFNNMFYDLKYISRDWSNTDESSVWNTTLQNYSPNIMGGPALGGNFYSNYTGTDANDDGIGDTTYPIPGNGASIDGYPLVRVYSYIAPDRGTIADSLSANNTFNITNPMGPNSNHSTSQNLTYINYTSGRKYLTIQFNFTQRENASHLRIFANDSAVAVNLTALVTRISNLTLYLNNTNNGTGIILCPHAQQLSDVGPNCLNRTVFRAQNVTDGISINHTLVRLNSNHYTIENTSATGAQLLADADLPNVSRLGMNITNATNLSQAGGVILFEVLADDRTTFMDTVRFGITNAGNNSQFNVTADQNGNLYNIIFPLSTLSNGFYTIRVYANDTFNNVNSSIANLSFTIDSVPPPVTVWTNYSGVYNGVSFNLSNAKLEVNMTSNDSTTYTQAVAVTFNSTNATGFNVTATRNASAFVAVIDTALITGGVTYTIIPIVNDSVGNSNNTGVNITFTVDRVAPPIAAFWMNASNASNLSSLLVTKLLFNASVNDTTLSVQEVRFGFYQGNASGFNVTGTKNFSIWAAEIDPTFILDGIYTVILSVNDTVDNRNNSIANLTFTLDRVPPNVTSLGMNFSNNSNFSAAPAFGLGKILFNATANDSTTYVQSVRFGFYSSNATGFNLTATRNFTAFSGEVDLAVITDGTYTVVAHANDSPGNINSSVANLTFTLDRVSPNVTQFLINFTTALNASNYTNTGGLELNVTANDSTLTVDTVKIGLTNDFRNGTESNISLTRTGPVYRLVLAMNTLTDGLYSLKVYANDTVHNVNNSVANLSFRIDATPPNVTTFGMNATNATMFDDGGVLQFNVSVNDSTTAVRNVTLGFTNNVNASQFNVTAVRNETAGTYHITLLLSPLSDGNYTVNVYATDLLGNMNNSVANLTFRVNSTPPVESISSGGSPSSPSEPQPAAIVSLPFNPAELQYQAPPSQEGLVPSTGVSPGTFKYGRACPPEYKLVGGSCVPYENLPASEPVFLDDLEGHVEELRPTVYVTKVAEIYPELPLLEEEKCVKSSFIPVQEVSAGLYRRALENLQGDRKYTIFNEINGDRIKILALFKDVKGTACIEINLNEKSSNPLLKLSWLSRITGLVTEEFCLNLNGNTVAVPQEFLMCPEIKQLADQGKLELHTEISME